MASFKFCMLNMLNMFSNTTFICLKSANAGKLVKKSVFRLNKKSLNMDNFSMNILYQNVNERLYINLFCCIYIFLLVIQV